MALLADYKNDNVIEDSSSCNCIGILIWSMLYFTYSGTFTAREENNEIPDECLFSLSVKLFHDFRLPLCLCIVIMVVFS